MNEIHTGDCRKVADEIKDGSVDVVLTDPPYGTMKGVEGIDGWDDGEVDWDESLPPSTLFDISNRILRKGGRAIIFSQEPYTSQLITQDTANLPFSYRMIWKKNVHGNTLMANTAPVNVFEDISIFTKQYDSEKSHPLREYAQNILDFIGKSLSQINKELGHRKAEHFFYVQSSQFELCTEETYKELINNYGIQNMDGFKPYDEIDSVDKKYKDKHEPTFNPPDNQKVKQNVLEYSKPGEGKHPTQKPVALLRDLIKTFSNSGDMVVDLTAGSGSTCVACRQTDRKYIGIEKDPKYAEIARSRVGESPKEPNLLRESEAQNGLEDY